MPLTARDRLDPRDVERINQHFGVDLFSLKPLAKFDEFAQPYIIDRYSILKITRDYSELNAIKNLISTQLSLDPGISVILPDDIIDVQNFGVYRTELLVSEGYRGGEFNQIAHGNKLEEKLTSLRYIIYDLTDMVGERPRPGEAEEISDYFIGRCESLGHDKDPHISNIVFFLYQALSIGLLFIDIKLGNSGFRFDKTTGTIDEAAGLVAFDLELLL